MRSVFYMEKTVIRQATEQDIEALTEMGLLLFEGNLREELKAEFQEAMREPDTAFFLLETDGKVSGFAQCQLRRDYVEGTQSSPVGYLEGIYVKPKYRRHGYAAKLLSACENFAAEKGCTEFASDCELHNAQSLLFHLGAGFKEANRIICFTKKL